jgi:nicotinamidase-related amidase
MTTMLQRDPKTDHLLTAENAALILIDYQPAMIEGTRSVDGAVLVNNVVALAKTAAMYRLPTILATVAVKAGFQEDTIAALRDVVPEAELIDRSAVNAWEDEGFRTAVEATGRRKLIMAALWTEVCLVFPALDLLQAGYEVYAVSDASGGSSVDAHERGMQRLVQAGAVPVTWEAVMAELGRLYQDDYAQGTFVEIMEEHLPKSVRSG